MCKIFIAVPCPETVASEFAQSLALVTGHLVSQGHIVNVAISIGSYLAKNRRELTEYFLKTNFEYILWLDADMKIPPDAGQRMLDREADIVACNYRRRRFPNPTFVACNYKGKFFAESEEVQVKEDSPETEYVDATGLGCCLIKREVIEKAGPPYFVIDYDKKKKLEIGEDLYFFKKCKDNGFKVLCDNLLSKQISHIGVFHFRWDLSY
jgi:hypothetical protein